MENFVPRDDGDIWSYGTSDNHRNFNIEDDYNYQRHYPNDRKRHHHNFVDKIGRDIKRGLNRSKRNIRREIHNLSREIIHNRHRYSNKRYPNNNREYYERTRRNSGIIRRPQVEDTNEHSESINGIVEYNKSISYVGKNEVDFFVNFFKTNNPNDFVGKVKDIQSRLNLEVDGKIGEKTLKSLYINIYANNFNILDKDRRLRLEEYIEMQKYDEHHREKNGETITPNYIPNVFNKNYYYGEVGTTNIKGTFIDKSLYNKIPRKINETGNHAFLKKVDGKFVVLLYINGNLKLASYSSPGINAPERGAINTPRGEFLSTWSSRYWISGTEVSKGAPMPDAVHITGGVFVHAGKVNGNPRSHGCVRIPKKYSKGFYELFRKYGNIKWTIDY